MNISFIRIPKLVKKKEEESQTQSKVKQKKLYTGLRCIHFASTCANEWIVKITNQLQQYVKRQGFKCECWICKQRSYNQDFKVIKSQLSQKKTKLTLKSKIYRVGVLLLQRESYIQ